jgi:2-iminobutanoate/2-iminopropanoate deaminase
VSKARQNHLGNHRPASTAVYVTRLVDPAWKVEIEAIAMIPDGRQ